MPIVRAWRDRRSVELNVPKSNVLAIGHQPHFKTADCVPPNSLGFELFISSILPGEGNDHELPENDMQSRKGTWEGTRACET